jgi:DNA-directed RNA polymerase subunit E'/Rpb7
MVGFNESNDKTSLESMDHSQIETRETTCILNPDELGSIQHAIETRLKRSEHTCTKEDGYIVDIVGIASYQSRRILMCTGKCEFSVQYHVRLLKPQPGQIYSMMATVCKEGIFGQTTPLRVLIPAMYLTEWEFHAGRYQHPITGQTITQGDWIRVRLEVVRFEGQFQCLGSLVMEES